MTPAPNPSVRLEPDHVSARVLLWIYVTALVVTAAGIASAWLATDRFVGARLPAGAPHVLVPTEYPAREIAMVEQTLIDADPFTRRLVRDKRARLETYGWTDRERELVHIPIEDAMRAIAEDRR